MSGQNMWCECRALWVTYLFDLLPEEACDGGAGVERHLHVIRRVQDLRDTHTERYEIERY